METTEPGTAERSSFVLYRQSTNDAATEFVSGLINRSINEDQVLKVLEDHEKIGADSDGFCCSCDVYVTRGMWAEHLSEEVVRGLLGRLR